MTSSVEQPLAGRTAVVTGASRGIGRAIAQRLASAGAHVVISGRSLKTPTGGFTGTLQEAAEEIRAMGAQATPLAVDMADPASREAFAKAALGVTGKVDILVNNAGTALYKPTPAYTYGEAMGQISTYFIGPWHLCNLLTPQMIARREGWILNVGSSSAVKIPQPPYERHAQYHGKDVMYGALKAGVHRLTQGLAAELSEHNIAVNLVAPVAGVLTPGLDSLKRGFTPDHPSMELPEQMAEAALALVSRPPSELTGVIAWSYRYLEEIGRSTMSLDGRTVLIDRSAAAASVTA